MKLAGRARRIFDREMVERWLWLLPLVTLGCDRAEANHVAPTASPSAAVPPVAASAPATASASAPPVCPTPCSSIERCEAGRCAPACPAGEIYIPPTPEEGFTMGAGLHGARDRPHRVKLTKPFCMDATEVTVAAYKACVETKGCKAPRAWGTWRNYPELLDHPVNKVPWKEAKAYCELNDKSLPTEAQWEWAATGGDNRKWAWGDDAPTCNHADFVPGVLEGPASDDGCHGGGTSPVGQHPEGDRVWPSGRIHDLSGNVWEWVLDNYAPYPAGEQIDPLYLPEPEGVHVVRGGGWNRSHRGIRTQYRGGAVVDYRVPSLGFRCVRNPT